MFRIERYSMTFLLLLVNFFIFQKFNASEILLKTDRVSTEIKKSITLLLLLSSSSSSLLLLLLLLFILHNFV